MHLDDCDWVTYDYGGEQMGPCNCGEPTRVLAWCAAMRVIVELHAGAHECSSGGDNCAWIDEFSMAGPTCDTLRLVAQALGVSVGE